MSTWDKLHRELLHFVANECAGMRGIKLWNKYESFRQYLLLVRIYFDMTPGRQLDERLKYGKNK